MGLSVPPLADRHQESRFYSAMVIAMAIVVFIGFSRTFYLKGWFPEAAEFIPPERFFSFHGAVFSAWLLLLVVQATLVRAGGISVHRRLGLAGMVLAAAVVISGIYGSLLAASRPGGFLGVPVPPEQFLVVPLGGMVLFGGFVTLAFRRRHGRKAHKRLIVLATVNLLDAAIVRVLPVAWLEAVGVLAAYWLADLFIVALAVWDYRSLGRLHPVTLWGGLLTIVSQPLRLPFAATDGWQAFASWAMALV